MMRAPEGQMSRKSASTPPAPQPISRTRAPLASPAASSDATARRSRSMQRFPGALGSQRPADRPLMW